MMKRSLVLIAWLGILTGIGCEAGQNPHERKGDVYFKAGRYDDAYAEYAVAARRASEDPELLRKMGKTSFLRRDLKGTRDAYVALLRVSPEEVDRVAVDFFQLGVAFHKAGDAVQMAAAFGCLFEVDSTYNIGEYYYDLADHFQNEADFTKAVKYYTRALTYHPEHDKVPESTFRLALSLEKLEKYRDALVYYEQYLHRFPRGQELDSVKWHLGACGYHVAREEFENGNPETALDYLSILFRTNQPRVMADDAWYLKGEIYLAIGRPDSALVAYERVLELNPSRTGRLALLSQERVREIKYGRR